MQARKGSNGDLALDALLKRLRVETVPFSETAARLARLGYARFGRGVGSPAVLNLGDCYAYGTAMALRQPLLFKGEDFRQTDVLVAEY
jgi:ribonuclease VapC